MQTLLDLAMGLILMWLSFDHHNQASVPSPLRGSLAMTRGEALVDHGAGSRHALR